MICTCEDQCSKLLVSANVAFDDQFVVSFKRRPDEREKRPLILSGRVISRLPLKKELKTDGDEDDDDTDPGTGMNLFDTSSIHKKPVLEADMLPTSEMFCIEDVSEDALPQSTNVASHIYGPEKAAQYGSSAAHALLTETLSIQSTRRLLLFVVDFNAHTCDCARAFLEKYWAQGQAAFYLGFQELKPCLIFVYGVIPPQHACI